VNGVLTEWAGGVLSKPAGSRALFQAKQEYYGTWPEIQVLLWETIENRLKKITKVII
jgi:hypothetical protein